MSNEVAEKPATEVAPHVPPKGRLVEITLDKIDPSPTNPRQRFRALEDLRDSIAQWGILENLVARPHPKSKDRYELIAGERRLRAGKMVDPELLAPVKIIDATDVQVLVLQVVENDQREDVHPLEQAGGYRRLLAEDYYGKDATMEVKVAALAKELGRSESFVWQRLKLADLIQPAKDAMLDHDLSASHAIQIARLRPQDQIYALAFCMGVDLYSSQPLKDVEKSVKEKLKGNEKITIASVRDLNGFIFGNLLLKLSTALWDRSDAGLLPQAGSCLDCIKRSGATSLFPELGKDDCCLDRECWKHKRLAHLEHIMQEQRKEHGGAVAMLTTGYRAHDWEGKGDPIGYHHWKTAKKGDCESTQPGVFVHIDQHSGSGNRKVGDVIFVCTNEKCKKHWKIESSGSAKSPIMVEREKELKRQKAIETDTRSALLAGMAQLAPAKIDRKFAEECLIELFVEKYDAHDKKFGDAFGWIMPEKLDYKTDWEAIAKKNIPKMTERQLREIQLRLIWSSDLKVQSYQLPVAKCKDLETAAAKAGVDVGLIRKEAEMKHPKKDAKPKPKAKDKVKAKPKAAAKEKKTPLASKAAVATKIAQKVAAKLPKGQRPRKRGLKPTIAKATAGRATDGSGGKKP